MNVAPSRQSVETGGAFVTTHWSVVLTAQGGSPAAQDALEQLCRIYWRPIYSFLRREGRTLEDAQDLTQFLCSLLNAAISLRPAGKRSFYVLISCDHSVFLANYAAGRCRQAGEGLSPISLEELRGESHRIGSRELSADRIYDRRWALTCWIGIRPPRTNVVIWPPVMYVERLLR